MHGGGGRMLVALRLLGWWWLVPMSLPVEARIGDLVQDMRMHGRRELLAYEEEVGIDVVVVVRRRRTTTSGLGLLLAMDANLHIATGRYQHAANGLG